MCQRTQHTGPKCLVKLENIRVHMFGGDLRPRFGRKRQRHKKHMFTMPSHQYYRARALTADSHRWKPFNSQRCANSTDAVKYAPFAFIPSQPSTQYNHHMLKLLQECTSGGQRARYREYAEKNLGHRQNAVSRLY